jgi:glycosyltransferase involved in cell wall biosynthesis
VVIFVGSLEPRKGPDLLIEACRRVTDPDFGLFIVGSGPMEPSLRNLASEVLGHRVWFWGYRNQEELAGLYALSDVFVLPSLGEPGSIVLSEALAAGLYVVSSLHDANSVDLIDPGVNGEIVDPADPNSLANGLGRAIEKTIRNAVTSETITRTLDGHEIEDYAFAFERAVNRALEQ